MKRINKIILYSVLFSIVSCTGNDENQTDVSLYLKSDGKQISTIESESGDLLNELGHHGPAVENEFIGLRMYFNELASIDLYSKKRPGLELAKARWYPSEKQQQNEMGGDQYKVGETIGLGSIRLWDGEKVQLLNPVSRRSARVKKGTNYSFFEMLSEKIPYRGKEVDILVRVTVFSGIREAKVEAFALSNELVQFVTGINIHHGMKQKWESNYLVTWGLHPEDVVINPFQIGSAIIFNEGDFVMQRDEKDEYLLISKPSKFLEYKITSANEMEKELNNMEIFEKYVSEISN